MPLSRTALAALCRPRWNADLALLAASTSPAPCPRRQLHTTLPARSKYQEKQKQKAEAAAAAAAAAGPGSSSHRSQQQGVDRYERRPLFGRPAERSGPSSRFQAQGQRAPAFSLDKGKGRAVDLSLEESDPGSPRETSSTAPTNSTPAVPAGAPIRDELIGAAKVYLARPVPEGAFLIPHPQDAKPADADPDPAAEVAAPELESSDSSDGYVRQEEGAKKKAKGSKAGGLYLPEDPAAILARMDRSQYWLLQVAPRGPGDNGQAWPIVRLVDKKQSFDKAKAKSSPSSSSSSASTPSASSADGGEASSGSTNAAVGSAPSFKLKELLLSWSTSIHDLSHKVGRLADDAHLKGSRVRVTVVVRKGQGRAFRAKDAAAKRAELLETIDRMMTERNESETGFEVQMEGDPKWKSDSIVTITYAPVGKLRG